MNPTSKLLSQKHEVVTVPTDETDLWFMDFDSVTLENRRIDDAKMHGIISTFLN